MAVVPRASSEADDALQFGTAITDYVPSPMDTSALQSQGVVLLTVGVMTAYWWYVLVPGARVNLAVNKRTGKLRDYLVELKDDDSRKMERFFYQKWLAKVDPETRYLLRDEPDLFEEGGATSTAAASPARMPGAPGTSQASQLKALTALLLATRNRIVGMAGQTGARRILKAVGQRPVPKGGDLCAAPPGRKF